MKFLCWEWLNYLSLWTSYLFDIEGARIKVQIPLMSRKSSFGCNMVTYVFDVDGIRIEVYSNAKSLYTC